MRTFNVIGAAKKPRFDTVTLPIAAFTRMAFRVFDGYLFLYNEVIFRFRLSKSIIR